MDNKINMILTMTFLCYLSKNGEISINILCGEKSIGLIYVSEVTTFVVELKKLSKAYKKIWLIYSG